jgi:hypothetical protein
VLAASCIADRDETLGISTLDELNAEMEHLNAPRSRTEHIPSKIILHSAHVARGTPRVHSWDPGAKAQFAGTTAKGLSILQKSWTLREQLLVATSAI